MAAIVAAGLPPKSCRSLRKRWTTGPVSWSWRATMPWRQTFRSVSDGSCSDGEYRHHGEGDNVISQGYPYPDYGCPATGLQA